MNKVIESILESNSEIFKSSSMQEIEDNLYKIHQEVWIEGFNHEKFQEYVNAVYNAENQGLDTSQHRRLLEEIYKKVDSRLSHDP